MDETVCMKVASHRYQPSRIHRLDLLFRDFAALDYPCAKVHLPEITNSKKGPLSTTCSKKRLSVADGTGWVSASGIQSFLNGISPDISIYYVRINDEKTEVAWLPSCRNRLED